jgi:hypothetical protein
MVKPARKGRFCCLIELVESQLAPIYLTLLHLIRYNYGMEFGKEDNNQGRFMAALSRQLGMPLADADIYAIETKENRVRVRYCIDGITHAGTYYFSHGGEKWVSIMAVTP